MLIPDNIIDFESVGERLLYHRFKNDGSCSGMYIMHSVFVSHHLRSICGELDFLILAPGMGFFAIEVKHGRVSRDEGTWKFTDRNGNSTTKTKSPFAQVTGTLQSIRSFVLNKAKSTKKQKDLSKILWGSGVAFTSMEMPPNLGQEAESWQILSKDGLRYPISYYIESLSKGFHHQYSSNKWYDVNKSRPSKEECEYLIELIRGDFDTTYTALNRIKETGDLIEELTKEQFRTLDITNYNPRCLFEGGAGTGKTLLAIELLRRNFLEGSKVALFCYNHKLGEYVQNVSLKIGLNASSYGGSFHKYLLTNTDLPNPEYNHQFFQEELPFEFMIQHEEIAEDDKYDLIIVDESQDLITPNFLEVLDTILKDGISNGRWVMFGDFSNQAIYQEKTKQEIISVLREKTDFVTLPPLKINCRNSKIIANQNTLLTGCELPQFRNGGIPGPSVEQKFPSRTNFISTIENIISSYIEKGVVLDEIIILAPKKLENTSLKESIVINNAISHGMSFSTIQSFKGLEKNIVIMTEFTELNTLEAKKLMYVGISRAKQQLSIILLKELEPSYQKLIQENFSKIN